MWTTCPSPLGEVLLEAQDGALVRVGFPPVHLPDGPASPDDPLLRAAAEELTAHLSGARRPFVVPVAPVGTPFQRRVWAALREVPCGETTTYRELAERVGAPQAVRAVGAANARNPVAVLVPCHRVVGSDGALRGSPEGVARKRALLALEGASLS